ncbi:MAG: ABC transporter substrate-binding protein [Myxococcales bacterium]|nr:ABC transporter substrate-binding protein [Myxococcales bacterium]
MHKDVRTTITPGRLMALLAVTALLLTGAPGCGKKSAPGDGAEAGPVTVDFWYSYGGRNREVTEELIKRFNDSHPDITINGTFQGDYFENLSKVRMASRTKRGPVATHIIGEAIPQLHEAGLLEDLDPYADGQVEGVEKLDRADFIPGLSQEGYFDTLGKKVPLVSLPFNRSTPIVYYNVKMFKDAGLEPPKTWEELVAVSKQLTVREGDETKVWGFEVAIDWWFWYAMLHQAGGSLLNQTGDKARFAEEPGIKALDHLVRMVKEHKSMKHPPGRDYNAWEVANTDFLNQKVAMIWTSTAYLKYFKLNAKFEVGTAFLPKQVKRAVPTGGTFFVIMKNKPEAEKRAAWTFIRWMSEPDQTAYWSRETGYMPVRRSALESEEMKAFYKENPEYRTTIDQLEHSVPFPFSPKLVEIQRKILKPVLERPVVEDADVAEVLKKAAEEANKLLASDR